MFFDKLKSVIKTPEIEFLCQEEDFGIIPKPYPSRKLMPDWFKALPQYKENTKGFDRPTIKRCPPFLDAMCIGWIIPLCADVEIKTNDDASQIDYSWKFYKEVIQNHFKWQITSDESPNPSSIKPPVKWLNYWAIRVPKGYSVLFVPPLNRPEQRFTCLSGMVDCDGYFEFVNFPFFFNIPNFTGIINAGTPLMQAIPIKRDTLIKNGIINKLSENDIKEYKKTTKRYKVSNSLYRNHIWERK